MNKKGIFTAVAITVLGVGAFATTQSFAQTTTDTTSPMSSLVKSIADKFGLKQADVQAVFDTHKSDMQKKREANFEKRLSTLVTEGKITETQKQLILTKHKELEAARQTSMQNLKSMTQAERKAAMDKERTDLESWAKSNNIDLQYLMPERGMKGQRGHGMDGPPQHVVAPSPTQ